MAGSIPGLNCQAVKGSPAVGGGHSCPGGSSEGLTSALADAEAVPVLKCRSLSGATGLGVVPRG